MRHGPARRTSGSLISQWHAGGQNRRGLVGMAAANEHTESLGDTTGPLQSLPDAGTLAADHRIHLPVHGEHAAVEGRVWNQLRYLQRQGFP